MDEDQRDYMLHTKLMRDDNEYDITASDIGLDKIRLENYATWKTKGTLYTQRYDKDNKKWSANFMVKPMAADANLESFAKFINGDKYFIDENQNETLIPITYGAQMVDLTDYAKSEHVKEIKSQIYINDELVDEVSASEKLKIDSNINYRVNKIDNIDRLILNVKIKSYLTTKFTTDGILTDIKEYTLVVYFSSEEDVKEEFIEFDNEKDDDDSDDKIDYNSVRTDHYINIPDLPPPRILNIEITRKNGNDEVNLYKPKSSNNMFICAGQTIVIRATVQNSPKYVFIEFQGDKSIYTFDDLTKKFEWDEPKSRNVKTTLSSLDAYKDMYSGKVFMIEEKRIDEATIQYVFEYIIPYGTKQTLNSWATLRKESKDAFNINESKLFTRIMAPYQVVVKALNSVGADTERFDLDVFERWDTLYNRDLSKYITKQN